MNREGLWKVLKMYDVEGKFLNLVISFYKRSKASVIEEEVLSEWFQVTVGMGQGCAMTPWVFNIYMAGMTRQMTERGV